MMEVVVTNLFSLREIAEGEAAEALRVRRKADMAAGAESLDLSAGWLPLI